MKQFLPISAVNFNGSVTEVTDITLRSGILLSAGAETVLNYNHLKNDSGFPLGYYPVGIGDVFSEGKAAGTQS